MKKNILLPIIGFAALSSLFAEDIVIRQTIDGNATWDDKRQLYLAGTTWVEVADSSTSGSHYELSNAAYGKALTSADSLTFEGYSGGDLYYVVKNNASDTDYTGDTWRTSWVSGGEDAHKYWIKDAGVNAVPDAANYTSYSAMTPVKQFYAQKLAAFYHNAGKATTLTNMTFDIASDYVFANNSKGNSNGRIVVSGISGTAANNNMIISDTLTVKGGKGVDILSYGNSQTALLDFNKIDIQANVFQVDAQVTNLLVGVSESEGVYTAKTTSTSTIANGATFTIGGTTANSYLGNMNVEGILNLSNKINNLLGALTFTGTGANMSTSSNSTINIKNALTFESGSKLTLNGGTINMSGENAAIVLNSGSRLNYANSQTVLNGTITNSGEIYINANGTEVFSANTVINSVSDYVRIFNSVENEALKINGEWHLKGAGTTSGTSGIYNPINITSNGGNLTFDKIYVEGGFVKRGTSPIDHTTLFSAATGQISGNTLSFTLAKANDAVTDVQYAKISAKNKVTLNNLIFQGGTVDNQGVEQDLRIDTQLYAAASGEYALTIGTLSTLGYATNYTLLDVYRTNSIYIDTLNIEHAFKTTNARTGSTLTDLTINNLNANFNSAVDSIIDANKLTINNATLRKNSTSLQTNTTNRMNGTTGLTVTGTLDSSVTINMNVGTSNEVNVNKLVMVEGNEWHESTTAGKYYYLASDQQTFAFAGASATVNINSINATNGYLKLLSNSAGMIFNIGNIDYKGAAFLADMVTNSSSLNSTGTIKIVLEGATSGAVGAVDSSQIAASSISLNELIIGSDGTRTGMGGTNLTITANRDMYIKTLTTIAAVNGGVGTWVNSGNEGYKTTIDTLNINNNFVCMQRNTVDGRNYVGVVNMNNSEFLLANTLTGTVDARVSTYVTVGGIQGFGGNVRSDWNSSYLDTYLTLDGSGKYISNARVLSRNTNTLNIIKNGTGTQVFKNTATDFLGSVQVNSGNLFMNINRIEANNVTVNGGVFGSAGTVLAITSLNMNGGKLGFDFGLGSNLSITLNKGTDLVGQILASDFVFQNVKGNYTLGNEYLLVGFEDSVVTMNTYLKAIVDSEDNGKYEYIDAVTGTKYFATYYADAEAGTFSVSLQVPEPSTYAAIFGLLALAFAIYRRRHN